MKSIAIIRERGQLTIPDSIRKLAPWAGVSSVVSISIENTKEIVITPHLGQNQLEWDNLFEQIKKARAIKGKGKLGANEFIQKEREL